MDDIRAVMDAAGSERAVLYSGDVPGANDRTGCIWRRGSGHAGPPAIEKDQPRERRHPTERPGHPGPAPGVEDTFSLSAMFWGNPQSRAFARATDRCEEDRTLRTVLVGMLREADR
jgi:hypothetical protein